MDVDFQIVIEVINKGESFMNSETFAIDDIRLDYGTCRQNEKFE